MEISKAAHFALVQRISGLPVSMPRPWQRPMAEHMLADARPAAHILPVFDIYTDPSYDIVHKIG
jgi:hypothetical protein